MNLENRKVTHEKPNGWEDQEKSWSHGFLEIMQQKQLHMVTWNDRQEWTLGIEIRKT